VKVNVTWMVPSRTRPGPVRRAGAVAGRGDGAVVVVMKPQIFERTVLYGCARMGAAMRWCAMSVQQGQRLLGRASDPGRVVACLADHAHPLQQNEQQPGQRPRVPLLGKFALGLRARQRGGQ
jgi:hypothetical protein